MKALYRRLVKKYGKFRVLACLIGGWLSVSALGVGAANLVVPTGSGQATWQQPTAVQSSAQAAPSAAVVNGNAPASPQPSSGKVSTAPSANAAIGSSKAPKAAQPSSGPAVAESALPQNKAKCGQVDAKYFNYHGGSPSEVDQLIAGYTHVACVTALPGHTCQQVMSELTQRIAKPASAHSRLLEKTVLERDPYLTREGFYDWNEGVRDSRARALVVCGETKGFHGLVKK